MQKEFAAKYTGEKHTTVLVFYITDVREQVGVALSKLMQIV
jgi:hypothetical protein